MSNLIRCLNCGKTRKETRSYFDSPCATEGGYEHIETEMEWPHHRWPAPSPDKTGTTK